jgi:hypothetical protein
LNVAFLNRGKKMRGLAAPRLRDFWREVIRIFLRRALSGKTHQPEISDMLQVRPILKVLPAANSEAFSPVASKNLKSSST